MPSPRSEFDISALRQITRRAVRQWALDPRALAAFRIGLALVVLVDLGVRAMDIGAFYTDESVLPRPEHARAFTDPAMFSLHLANGDSSFIAAMLGVQALAALCLLVGWRTRWAHALTWLLLISLQNRNPMVLQGGDILLRLLLFWSFVLPLGARWSLDARRVPAQAHPPATGIGAIALLTQLCVVYWYGLVLKSGLAWRDGTAVHFALHIDQFATHFGVWLRQYESLTSLLTYGTWWLELVGPLLVVLAGVIPRGSDTLRLVGASAMMLLHVGFGLGLSLGLFPAIAVVGWLVWLPPAVWDRVEQWGSRVAKRPVPDSAAVPTRPLPPLVWWPVALLLVYAVLWNNSSVAKPPTLNLGGRSVSLLIPKSLQPLGRFLGLDQRWDMFAPHPFVPDGWYVVVGTTPDGRIESLWPAPDGATGLDKPVHGAAAYSSQRWRKYWMNLWYPRFEPHRQRALNYLCGRASRSGRPVEAAYMLYVEEVTVRPGEVSPPLDCRVLRAQRCRGSRIEPSEALPAPLARCDGLAYVAGLAHAAGEICECGDDSRCQARAWRVRGPTVERHLAQVDRGTSFALSIAQQERVARSIRELQTCWVAGPEPRLR